MGLRLRAGMETLGLVLGRMATAFITETVQPLSGHGSWEKR